MVQTHTLSIKLLILSRKYHSNIRDRPSLQEYIICLLKYTIVSALMPFGVGARYWKFNRILENVCETDVIPHRAINCAMQLSNLFLYFRDGIKYLIRLK